MSYTPGSISALLGTVPGSSATHSEGKHGKQTKLQALFNAPASPVTVQTIKLERKVATSDSKKNRKRVHSPVLDVESRSKKRKSSDSSLLHKREEVFRNAELKLKQKLKREPGIPDAVEESAAAAGEDSKVKKEKWVINQENAQRRIEGKIKPDVKLPAAPLKPRDQEQEKRTVFVGNVPLAATKKTLLRLFSTCGRVESLRIRCYPIADLKLSKKANFIKNQSHPMRHSTNAYVVYKVEEDAKKALSLNGTDLGGCHIRVDMSVLDKKHDHEHSVFVGNLPLDAEEEALRQHFAECGNINNVRIIRDSCTGAGKGFGYVTFTDTSAVTLALGLNGQEFSSRPLRVQRSVRKPKPSGTAANAKVQRGSKSDTRNKKKHNKILPSKPSGQRHEQSDGKQQGPAVSKKTGETKESKSEQPNSDALAKPRAADAKKRKELRKKTLRKKAHDKKKKAIGELLTKKSKATS